MATVSVFALLLVAGLATSLYMQEAAAVTFSIKNQCEYTVWPAGSSWTKGTRFWDRTGCSFDGKGSCQTGDCAGQLSCTVSGAVPATLAEYTLNGDGNKDFDDVSLVDGFNIPLSINPTNAQCTTTACKADVNGGCNSACNVFQTDQYCCRNAYKDTCPATKYSMIFKQQCPQAYSYAKDDTDYSIVFCP